MLIVLLVLAPFIVFSPLLWCSIVLLISAVSGWSTLAQVYKSDIPMQGQKIWAGRLLMGRKGFLKSQYSNVVRVSCDPEHLYIGVMLPFRMGHPNLKIPFSDITVVNAKPTIMGTRRKKLQTQKAPTIEILLSEKEVKEIENRFSTLANTKQKGA